MIVHGYYDCCQPEIDEHDPGFTEDIESLCGAIQGIAIGQI